MYPFFVMGYILSQNHKILHLLKSNYFMIIVLPAFVLCSIFFSKYTIMFVPPRFIDVWISNANYLYIIYFYSFFLTAGMSGIYVCYKLMRLIPVNGRLYALLNDMGRYTFIMYMLQGLWFFSFCRQYQYHVVYQSLAFVLGILVTYVLYRVGKMMALDKRTSLLAGYRK